MKMECPWKGCNNIIDLTKEFREFQYYLGTGKKVEKIPWCIHTLLCSKCHNPIGGIDLGPDAWITLGSGNASVHDPKDIKKGHIIKDYANHKRKGIKKLLNPYLKEWAKVK